MAPGAASASSENVIPGQLAPDGSTGLGESEPDPSTETGQQKTATGNSTTAVGQTMASSVKTTIGGRILNRSDSFGSGAKIAGHSVVSGHSGKSLRSMPPTGTGQIDESKDPDAQLMQLINGASFHLVLGGQEEHSEYSDAPQLVLWGGGDHLRFRSKTFEIDGKVRSGFLGVEGHWNNGFLGGGALSYQVGETRYAYEESGHRKTGRIDTRVSSFHPYASMDLAENFRVWGIAGFGSGEVSDRPETGGEAETADLSTRMMVVGASYAVEPPDGIEISVLGDVGTFKLKTDATGGGSLSGIDATVRQFRLGVAGAVNNRYDWGILRPYGQLAIRVDDGDGITGEWVEVSAGLAVSSGRWIFDGSARSLLGGSDDDYKETGLQFTVKMNPMSDGTGASMQLDAGVKPDVQNVEAILSSKALAGEPDATDSCAANAGAGRIRPPIRELAQFRCSRLMFSTFKIRPESAASEWDLR